ncbi:MAG: hydantoinase B/oxoprolinase family protein [Phenylobacterium sp.]|uniref:hydantoinase B/oxoprolinase family protein n=1 Tax=Phenylobacterium sp. TaxID=1871053 RepID=UPI0025CFB75F|nr:hydantoinase B/oxoprolinase family protein [Phenylobacterium sp.]MCA4915007.1 hydantoinase B/oxoprolinase family protein [Phenylobacterium sp.]
MDRRWTFWIDRGGTFTDVVGRTHDGREATAKLLSVSSAWADSAVEGMRRLMDLAPGAPFPGDLVEAIRMGTTVATNALLERRFARTLLVTTRGFADALRIGDQARPDLFALDIRRPEPLFAGVLEADERLAADGSVVEALDPAALGARLAEVAPDYDAVAVAFLHSDLNPVHERLAGRLARAAGVPFVALSHEVSPLPRFLPRAETTVADACLTPVLRAYVDQVQTAVGEAPLWFMTSAGGLVRASAFRGRDAVLSGPAGGVSGVAATARAAGAEAVIGFDMGGTSTDVCRFAGILERRETAEVAGVRLRAPMVDVETVAAGGGSILHFDGDRARAGPASAGADPGPAAYGRGGPATVTDANLVLGRLDPARFPAVFGPEGRSPLDAAAARATLSDLAARMDLPGPEAAAEGFLAVAVEQTAQAVRRISTERGFDPREHALVAFGGAAGQVACDVAEALGIDEVLCPGQGSVLSAWGMGQARPTVLRQAGLEAPLDGAGLGAAADLAERLGAEALAGLSAQGIDGGEVQVRLGLRYDGADAVLAVAPGTKGEVREAFEAAHRRLFGFTETDRAVLVARVEAEAVDATLPPLSARRPRDALESPGAPLDATMSVMQMTCRSQSFAAPVVEAAALTRIDGPALIVRDDTQLAVLPGWRAAAEADGLVRLTRISGAAPREVRLDRPDPVTLELFNRRFMGVAEAMGAALERTAHSVNIKERLDFSCALFDADGGLVANAPHMPVHLGSMGASVRAVRDRRGTLRPGEAFALNNPYAGGTHLPDITVVMPVFTRPEAEGPPDLFVAARGHHADVGGVQPGSMPPFSQTLEEEGILLDALPIMRDGIFLEAEVREALLAGPWPCRAPDRNLADLKAQLAACQTGADTLSAMIRDQGAEVVARYMTFVQANAASAVRRALTRLSDGEAKVPMDGGGRIAVRLTLDPDRQGAEIDFSSSSDQAPTNFNAPSAIVDAAVLYVFRTLVDDDIPLNAGCLEPLRVRTRPGSLLAPAPPAAVVAGNVETSQHVVDALYSALGVMANAQGSMNNFTFGDADRQYYETLCGGAGASVRGPGASGVHTHMTNSRLTDPEILERRFPVRLETFEIRKGSGGEGAFRGGDGVRRRLRFLAPMEAALLSTRRTCAPQGLAGGGPALAGAQRLIRADGAILPLAGCFSVTVAAGEAIEIETPGGGGYGPPAAPPAPDSETRPTAA